MTRAATSRQRIQPCLFGLSRPMLMAGATLFLYLLQVCVMDKDQVAFILNQIGTLLELQGENPFRCNAYFNGARAVEQMESDLGELVATGKLDQVPGIGETLREKITTLVTTGRLPFYEE